MLKLKFILFWLSMASLVKAQPSGPNSPGTTSTDATVGTITWSNTGNIVSSDDTRSNAVLNNNGDVTYYLTATNFGFAITTGSTIDGIVVEIERSDNGGGGNIKDNIVKIIKGGTITGTDKASSTNWPSSDAYKTYGNATDLWGTTWTVADINASNFGIAISAKRTGGGGNNQGRIDHIRITVYYTLPLPVEMLYFKVSNKNNVANLEWATASEFNNEFFMIEKSTDAIHFMEIGRVSGKGNSSVINLYTFIDKEPFSGINYYRINQFDFNGNNEVFNIVSCAFTSEYFKIIINVFDISGRLIKSAETEFYKKEETIKSLGLSAGVYIIQSTIDGGTTISVEKYLIKQ